VRDDLRELIARGETKRAIDVLYREYGDDLRRFVRLQVPRDSVEDLCQEIWAAARGSIESFRFESSPRGWVLSIARNKVADRWRRRSPQVELDSREFELALLDSIAPTTPTQALHRRRQRRVLASVLEELSESERELVLLRFVMGLKPAEIVQTLGLDIPVNTMSQRLVRVVKRLREALARHDEFASRLR
jgi:RNA polymerase sigma-70 factor (ECF subfamily)